MTPFRRKLLMKKKGSSEKLVYEKSSHNFVTTANLDLTLSETIPEGKTLKIVYDWEAEGTNTSTYSINVRTRYTTTMFSHSDVSLLSVARSASFSGSGSCEDTAVVTTSGKNIRIQVVYSAICTVCNFTNLKIYLVD